MKKLLLFQIFLLVIITSCISSSKIESLYVGDGILQYFVYPTNLKNTKSKISIDITYRAIKGSEGFVVVNFSYYYDSLFSEVKEGGFVIGDKIYSLFDIKTLYQEKREHHIRYTSKIKEIDFLEIVKVNSPSFFIITDVEKSVYPATNEFKEKLNELAIELF